MNSNRLQNIGILVLRVVVGLVICYHGAQKLLGLWGGMGFQATVNGFETHSGIPPFFAVLAIVAEFFGGLGMAFGFLTRLAAFGVASVMAVAVFKHATEPGLLHSIFVNVQDPGAGKTLFFPLVIFAGAVAVLLIGGGAFTLDSRLFRGKKAKK